MITKRYFRDLVYQVNGAAIEVHKNLGPGLLESVYHKCMKKELDIKGINYQSEKQIPIYYKGIDIEADLRYDLLIEDNLIVELKATEGIIPIHEAQLLTYMKLLDKPMGLLINFNVKHLFSQGQKTYVNELYRLLED